MSHNTCLQVEAEANTRADKAERERDAAVELLREHRRQAAFGGCSRNRHEIAAYLDELTKPK